MVYLTLNALLQISDEPDTDIATGFLFIPTPRVTGVTATHWNNMGNLIIFLKDV